MALPYRNNSYGQRLLIRLGVFALILAVAWLAKREPEQRPNPSAAPRTQRLPERERPNSPAPPTRAEKRDKAEAEDGDNVADDVNEKSSLIIRGLVLRDEDGNVVYRGNIDLQPTLARIAANRKLRFSNDGIVFENRERRLPRQASGYYHEWVVPTPGERGPGPQRLVIGTEGEVWYTSDHYRTFRRIPYPLP